MDLTSQCPYVMPDPKYFYTIGEPVILIKGRNNMMPIDTVLGLMKVLIDAPDIFYFPLLLERSSSGKIMYP